MIIQGRQVPIHKGTHSPQDQILSVIRNLREAVVPGHIHNLQLQTGVAVIPRHRDLPTAGRIHHLRGHRPAGHILHPRGLHRLQAEVHTLHHHDQAAVVVHHPAGVRVLVQEEDAGNSLPSFFKLN